MVINNENNGNISMYKQANPTPTVDPNDANNPLPAALMLGAIGGVAGLGGSLLSKKQRKHKLRNTLLGATALPAAFLAANKWGPEAVKSKLNEFSGNVYKGYEDYIAGRLPGFIRDYIGSQSVNTQSGVTKQKGELDKIQEDKATHEQTKKREFKPMPQYRGLTYEAYETAKQNLNPGKDDTSTEQLESKQTDLNSQLQQLQANQASENEIAESAYNAARAAVAKPESTEAWKKYEANIAKLKADKKQAVLTRLRSELESGKLAGRARQEALMVIDDLDSIASNRVEAENNLAAAQKKVDTFNTQLQELRSKYQTKNKQLEGNIEKHRGREKEIKSKLYDRKGSKEYQNARKDYDTKELDALQKTLELYDPKKSDLTGQFVQKLIEEGNTDAAEALSVLTPLEQEFANKFSAGALSARQAEALEKAKASARPQAEINFKNDVRKWRETSGRRAIPTEEEVPSVESRVDAVIRPQRESILRAAEEQFNKDRQAYILNNLAKPRDTMRGIIYRAVTAKNKRIGELTAQLDAAMRAGQDKLRREVIDSGAKVQLLEKELKNRRASGFSDLQEMTKLEDQIGAAKKEIEKYQGILNSLDGEREYSSLIDNLLKQYGDEYDVEHIQPLETKKRALQDTYTSNLGALKNNYDLGKNERNSRYAVERSDLEKQLASIASRLTALQKEKELDARWQKDQDDYRSDISKWDTQYGEDLEYNRQWDEKLNSLSAAEAEAQDLLNYLSEGEGNKRRIRQNQALAATGGGAGLIVLLSALDKLRKRKKKEISPEEYLNYLEEEGMA